MKKVLLVMGLLVSAAAFAENVNLLDELNALEAEYQNLSAQEQARFEEERTQAVSAQEALSRNEALHAELSDRVSRLSSEANTKFYKDQYEELAKRYENALEKLDEEMAQQRAVIEDFQKIQSLRAN